MCPPVENDFLPFATSGGANVQDQADYTSDAQRSTGNQPGIARSDFVNKTLRQSAWISNQLAQFLANVNNTDVLDNTNAVQMAAALENALGFVAPSPQVILSGSGSYVCTHFVQCAAANANSGAVYTDGTNSFTVGATISAGIQIQLKGNNQPKLGTGTLTLTKSSGTGDATITYYAARSPLYLITEMSGGGGGGGATGAGSNGSSSTFGTVTCNGGNAGAVFGGVGGVGGLVTTSVFTSLLALQGGSGGRATGANNPSLGPVAGTTGGVNAFGGSGATNTTGTLSNAVANTGAGGGGGTEGTYSGGAGGAGAYFKGFIPFSSFSASFPTGCSYSIGAGGGGNSNGSSNGAGNGGSGIIIVTQYYQ